MTHSDTQFPYKGGTMKAKTKKEEPWRERIKALIARHGSPEAVAAELGVSYPSIVRWLKGKNPSRMARNRILELERKVQP